MPNDRALCTACYVRETHVPPEVLTRLKTPGVIVSHKKKAGHAKTKWEIEADEKAPCGKKSARCIERRAKLTTSSVCTWCPDKSVPRERGLMCENLVMICP